MPREAMVGLKPAPRRADRWVRPERLPGAVPGGTVIDKNPYFPGSYRRFCGRDGGRDATGARTEA